VASAEERRDAISRKLRDERVWDLHCSGVSQAAIGRQLGMTKTNVNNVVRRRTKRALGEGDAEAYRAAFVHQLDRLRAMVTEVVDSEAPPAFTMQGVPLVDPSSGRQVRDYSAKLTAARVIALLIGQEAKILGLEAPTKIDVSLAVSQATDAAQAAAAQAKAFLESGSVVVGEVVPDDEAG
jgi:hypothetical protein